ncbi:hypothetical protein [uncultured Croceitalea sp.]|uniref:hypothetical protein n=1 Tax=uncultured Croceitalea sp. TaxID=1798908 RepID=UPI003305F298
MKTKIAKYYVLGLFVLSSCSKIPLNNDPILGIWTLEQESVGDKTNLFRREWIFNDAYLGRYHYYVNDVIMIETDYRWTKEDTLYYIDYNDIEVPNEYFHITEEDGHQVIINIKNEVVGRRVL